jgi:hypothetical protein
VISKWDSSLSPNITFLPKKTYYLQEYLHTVRELFKQDGCMDYSDKELLNWLTTNQNHRGKALAALSESLASAQKRTKSALLYYILITVFFHYRISALVTLTHFSSHYPRLL